MMIYLVRHGESTANINKRYCGITDVELSLLGKEQARNAALYFKGIDISNVYSSPLKRAYETACAISEITGVKVQTNDCLVEVNFGIFENKTWDEMVLENKIETDKWIKLRHKYKFPSGESYDDIIKRISEFIDKIEDNSIIVSHFGVIQAILLYLNIADDNCLWDYHISNCDILVLNNKKFERIIRSIKSLPEEIQ